MAEKHIITSESVTEGHPDKLCDQISDAVLDTLLLQDKMSRVAVNSFVTNEFIVVGGEVTTKGKADYEKIARDVLRRVGYTNHEIGIGCDSAEAYVRVHNQSADIAQGVDETDDHEQGAGDQGMMYGFACDETEELMPLPIMLAHKMTRKLAEARRSGLMKYLRPDGKSQVSIEYSNGLPKRAEAIVISTQHNPDIQNQILRSDVMKNIIKPICGKWIDKNTKIHINPTGRFVIGGPSGDTGLTGRKIIVDSYGGIGRHGGGAFSGKDPTKVDRSATYAARYVAKNIVASGLAKKCEFSVSYAIGVAEPTSINIDCSGTNKIPEEEILKLVRAHFDLRPRAIITKLNLRRPIYEKTAAYGHFGRTEPEFTWERTDLAPEFRSDAKVMIKKHNGSAGKKKIKSSSRKKVNKNK